MIKLCFHFEEEGALLMRCNLHALVCGFEIQCCAEEVAVCTSRALGSATCSGILQRGFALQTVLSRTSLGEFSYCSALWPPALCIFSGAFKLADPSIIDFFLQNRSCFSNNGSFSALVQLP